jgi:hypothetical protein
MGAMSFVGRSDRDGSSALSRILTAVKHIDPEAMIGTPVKMVDFVGELPVPGLSLSLRVVFGVLAVILVGGGLYALTRTS